MLSLLAAAATAVFGRQGPSRDAGSRAGADGELPFDGGDRGGRGAGGGGGDATPVAACCAAAGRAFGCSAAPAAVPVRLLLVGTGGAGKTTVLERAKRLWPAEGSGGAAALLSSLPAPPSTIGMNLAKLVVPPPAPALLTTLVAAAGGGGGAGGGATLERVLAAHVVAQATVWDLGGAMRSIWPRYYRDADGVLVVVDAAACAASGVDAACDLVAAMLGHEDLDEEATVVAVLCNKADITPADVLAALVSRLAEVLRAPRGDGGSDGGGISDAAVVAVGDGVVAGPAARIGRMPMSEDAPAAGGAVASGDIAPRAVFVGAAKEEGQSTAAAARWLCVQAAAIVHRRAARRGSAAGGGSS